MRTVETGGRDRPTTCLDVRRRFPGFKAAPAYLQARILEAGAKVVADIGGGANPMLSGDFVRSSQIEYHLIDISESELSKASNVFGKVCVDACAPTDRFLAALGDRRFDFLFSHMFLEHVDDPVRLHRNMYAALAPGGLAVHFYPSPNNIPLLANRLLPDDISTMVLRVVQPERNNEGHLGKFPAYYRQCGKTTSALHKFFAPIGFEVVEHIGYVGHDYYKRFPPIAIVEKAMRPLLVAWGVGLTSFELLVLQKPRSEPAAVSGATASSNREDGAGSFGRDAHATGEPA